MNNNVYGWFERVDKGVYALSPKGKDALRDYAHIIKHLESLQHACSD